MTTYIAFLRGINVGAHNRMKMDALRELCESLGFEDVRTYIQSGNVVFESEEPDAHTLETELADAIEASFGYDISVVIRTRDELGSIIEGLPFEEPTDDGTKLYVTFLDEEPGREEIQALSSAGHDAETFVVSGRDVYSQIRKDELKRGQFTDVGKVLRVPATRRAWNVATRVHELAH